MAARITRLWLPTRNYDKGARVREYTYSDGSKHYQFKGRGGYTTMDIDDFSEVERILNNWKMVEVDTFTCKPLDE